MPMSPRLLRPRQTGFDPRSIAGLALWLDAADSSTLYTTDAGPVTAVSSPLDIAGCVGWYDSSDLSAMRQNSDGTGTVADGDSVGRWNDKSATGANVTGTGTARPTLSATGFNGRRALVFNGSTTNLSFANYTAQDNLTGLTRIVVAAQVINTPAWVSRVWNGAANGLMANGGLRVFVNTAGDNYVTFQVPGISGSAIPAAIYSTVYSNSAVSLNANGGGVAGAVGGTLAANTGSGSSTLHIGSNIGASQFWNGPIAEYIVFNRALTPAELSRVEAYLAAKWGISGVHAPATATNDPVGAWLDKSGNGRHMLQPSSSPRPVRSTQNNRSSLSFNGTSQWMRQERTNYQARTYFTVWRRTGTPVGFAAPIGANGTVAAALGGSAYASSDASAVTFYSTNGNHWWSVNLAANKSTAARYQGAALNVTDFNLFSTGARIAPDTTGVNVVYVDAANSTAGNKSFFAGIEPFADNRLYSCQLLEVLLYNGSLTEAQSRQVERYLASKWNITLAPQVSNADAQDWINRVYANGGTVSAATANAVNQFCLDIENAGIRDRFYRLNLFCGTSDASLNAVRTPLFRGQSLAGTQYGNATDTNVNFVAGDYAETGASGGLLGNGSTKLLRTGLATNALTVGDRHLSAYEVVRSGATFDLFLGSDVAGSQQFMLGYGSPANVVRFGYGAFSANLNSSATTTGGHWLGVNPTTTSGIIYKNGVADGNNNMTAATPPSYEIYAFANNRDNAATDFYGGRLGGYSIGASFTAAQALAYYSAMQAFQTALGRQV